MIIDELKAHLAAETASADAALLELARRVVGGDAPTVPEVAATLRSINKTADDLDRLTRILQKRAEARQRLAAADSARRRRAEIEADVRIADEALARARAEHDRAVAPLRAEVAQCDALVVQASTAQHTLESTCPDRTLLYVRV